MTAYQKCKHDIGITNVGTDGTGTAVTGMMLVRDKTIPVYAEFDGKYLADRFFTNEPSQEYTNPEQELIMYQNDWRRGFGQYLQDDNKRYHASYGMDLSNKGMAIAGWNSTALTLPTPHTASAYNLPINHADPAGDWSNEANAYDNNTGTGATCTLVSGAGYKGVLEFYFPAATCTKVKFYWTESAGNLVGGVLVEILSTSGTWSTIRSDETLPVDGNAAYCEVDFAATTIYGARISFKDNTANGTVTLCELQYYTTSASVIGSPKKGITFNDLEYFPIANTLFKLNGTGNGFTLVEAFPNTITQLVSFQVSGTDYLMILLGLSDNYWYMTTGEVSTESTAVVNTFKFGAWVHTTADTMYASDSNYTIRSTTNPLNGGVAWSAQTIVGLASDSITGLKSHNGALYILKEDMPYYLNSAGAVQNDLAPELISAIASTSGKNSHVWQNELFVQAGDQALLKIGTDNEYINPSKYGTNISDFSGQIQAIASDEEWLRIAIDNATKVEILKGRLETIDGETSWVWHPEHELTLGGCEAMWVSTVYQKRLWIVSTSSSDSIYYLPLPTKYGDITNDSNASFKTGTYFETSYLHGNFNGEKKAYIKITLEMGHAYDANIYFTVSYKKLGDSAWTSIGTFDGTSVDRTESKYIPVDGSSNKPISTAMKFKITAVTNDTAKTPILLNYKVSAVLYPTIRRVIYAKVIAAENVLTKDSRLENNREAVIETINNLRNWTYPTTIYDIDGTATTVKYLPMSGGTPKFNVIRDDQGKEIERHYNLMLQVIPIS